MSETSRTRIAEGRGTLRGRHAAPRQHASTYYHEEIRHHEPVMEAETGLYTPLPAARKVALRASQDPLLPD